MIRLFLPPEQLSSAQIVITGEQARYLSLVLRVKPGDPLTIFDGLGFRYICKILQSHKKEVVAERIKKEPYSVESPVSITLAQGIPKSDKMDFIIQKSTELGIRKIIPLITERSQVRHTDKIERWGKIALNASQQSGRDKIPEIDEPKEFREFLNESIIRLQPTNENENTNNVIPAEARNRVVPTGIQKKDWIPGQARNDLKEIFPTQNINTKTPYKGIIFSEEKKERNLKQVLNSFKNTKNIIFLIGPEGGFSKEEVNSAVDRGFIEVSLGPRMLRTETAPIAAISIIQYELGDVG